MLGQRIWWIRFIYNWVKLIGRGLDLLRRSKLFVLVKSFGLKKMKLIIKIRVIQRNRGPRSIWVLERFRRVCRL